MKTFVDLSWIRGKAKCVLIDEIKYVADENNFSKNTTSNRRFNFTTDMLKPASTKEL